MVDHLKTKSCIRREIDKIKQQKLGGCVCVPDFMMLSFFFILTTVTLFSLGIIFHQDQSGLNSYSVMYDKSNTLNHCSPTSNSCIVKLEIQKDLTENVKFYFKFQNFYSNHRQYVKSRSFKQLRGNTVQASQVNQLCDPVVYYKDLGTNVALLDSSIAHGNQVADPCGSIAKYFPSDKLKLYKGSVNPGSEIPIDPNNIAREADREHRFKNNGNHRQYRNKEDQRFIVWYQMETFPNFIKLWGHIHQPLEAGTYFIEITDYDNALYSSGVRKGVQIQETGHYGGPNPMMASVCWIGGTVTVIFGVLLSIFNYIEANEDRKLD